MSAMVENGRAHTPVSSNLHSAADNKKDFSTSKSDVNNLHTVTELLKERLIHPDKHEDRADIGSPISKNSEYLHHPGSVSENAVHDLTTMVSRHVSMMTAAASGYVDADSARKRKEDQNDSSSGNSSMIGKLLQRDQDGGMMRNPNYEIDVDGDSMPSITTPNDFSSEELSDQENNLTSANSPTGGDFMEEDEEFNEELNMSGSSISSRSKRERVENIISNINRSSSPVKETALTPIDQRRHKRKQYTPQQHDGNRSYSDEPEAKMRRLQQEYLETQIKVMNEQLMSLRQSYKDLYAKQTTDSEEIDLAEVEKRCHRRQQLLNGMQEKENKINELSKHRGLLGPVEIDSSLYVNNDNKLLDGNNVQCKSQVSPLSGDTPKDLENLAVLLKNEIKHSVGTLVDTVFARFVEEARKQKEKVPMTPTIPAPAAKDNDPPKAKTPEPAPKSPAPTPPVLSHSIHKITNNNNNEIKPITIAPKQPESPVQVSNEKQQSPVEKARLEQPRPNRSKVTDKIINPFFDHHKPSFADLFRHAPLFPPPPPPYFHPLTHPIPPMFPHHQPKISEPEPEQTEALSLVVNTPKKKKVPTATLR